MKIIVDCPPVPKGRPRFTRSGIAYTPSNTRQYEDIVRLYARTAKIHALTGDIRAVICFYMPIPKSWSKRKKQLAINGDIKPSVKPDIDNLCKAVLDALNGGIAYHDDKQIVELHLSKMYSDHPRTEIELEEL